MSAPTPASDLSTKHSRFSPVTAVFLIVLVDMLGYTIILPLLPFYAAKFGASPFTIGLLFASFAICQLLSGPILGRLSDRMGRKPLLMLSQVGTCLGFLIVCFAGNLFWVFVGRILDGLTAGNISLAQAAMSDHTAPRERAKAFGKIGIAFGIGFLIGPALSGFLAQFSYQAPILVGAGLSALSIAATYFLLPQDAPLKKSEAASEKAPFRIFEVQSLINFFRIPHVRLRLIQIFLFILSFATYTSGIALFANRQLTINGQPFGPSEVAYLLAYGGLLGIILQGFIVGKLVHHFGEQKLVKAGFISMAVGFAILSFAHRLPLALFALTFASFGHGVLRPSLSSLLSQSATRHEQGALLGVSQSMQSIAQVLSPLIGGYLIDRSMTASWAVSASIFAGIGLCMEWAGRRFSGRGKSSPAASR